MNFRMWPPRSASSFETNTSSATRQATRSGTASIDACKSSWYSRAACLLSGRSGDLAIMLRRSKFKVLKPSLIAGLCLALAAPGGATWAQKPDDVVIKVDTRLVVLHATVVDKNG